MKKKMILFCIFISMFCQSLSCYPMSNKKVIDDIKYEYYNVIKKNLSKYYLETKTTSSSSIKEVTKIYSDNGYIKLIIRNKSNNSGKYLEELYMTDNGNKFLYIESKGKQKRYYYNNCGELIRYIDENGSQFDY